MKGKQMATSLSRTAIEQYIRCPKCFYFHRKLGLKPPSMVPLTLAVATDALLKNEFDAVRKSASTHPLWLREKLNVLAFDHPDIDLWRNNFKGIRVKWSGSDIEIFGAVDDVWINNDTHELHVVDYKSTSKQGIPTIEGGFGDGYKRQMEIYQWLLSNIGFRVSSTGYFLYVNGNKHGGFYEADLVGTMKFETTMISYAGDFSWVEPTIKNAIECLSGNNVPNSGSNCDSCRYYTERNLIGSD